MELLSVVVGVVIVLFFKICSLLFSSFSEKNNLREIQTANNLRDPEETTTDLSCLIRVGPKETYNSDNKHEYFDLKGHKEISQIFLSVGESGITSIRFQYVENGKYVLSDLYGSCSNINQFHTIELEHRYNECITGVKGLYSSSGDPENIQVITFTTNRREYGPFGLTSPNLQSQFVSSRNFTYSLGKPSQFGGGSCQFGGFHGSYNSSSLLSIGFYLDVKTMPKIPMY